MEVFSRTVDDAIIPPQINNEIMKLEELLFGEDESDNVTWCLDLISNF